MTTDLPYGWQRARLHQGALIFDTEPGLAQALTDGFFFVAQPAGLELEAGDRFAQRFYLPATSDDPFCGFARWTETQLGKHEGYFRRDVDQTEQFFLERRFWSEVYPAQLAAQAEAMRAFSLELLGAVLAQLDLPRTLWDEATGRCLSGRGTYHLTFNHFRSSVRARGLNIHKDSGWVTVLRSLEPGLEVERGGAWLPISPLPGFFIVNFGCAMEVLTRQSRTPVAAVAHRVVEQPEHRGGRADRFSYALFADSSLDEAVCPGLFCYEPERGLTLAMSFRTFLDEILKNTYQPETAGLY
ncbi:MAG: 2OG-Fe(II) oxygenase family protein [Kofleriaceae bacterium]